MLRGSPLPSSESLTPRARRFAFPEFSAKARALIDQAMQDGAPDTIDTPSLLETACAKTGLSDFGDAPLLEPLTALCNSLNGEMELHALGRLYLHQQLLGLLTTRLRLVDLWSRHPEILAMPIERPIIIIGLPRSGTTILHKLLGRDAKRRLAPFWEQVMPLPIGAASADGLDPRIALAQSSLDTLHAMAPDLAQMHEMSIDEPDEDILQLMYGFSSLQFEWSYVVPGYSRFYQAADHTIGYLWFRRVLQTLQWLRGGSNRWELKAPQHLEQLEPLTNAFPDAILVQTHRDPVTAVVSLASLTTYGQRRYFEHPNPLAVGPNIAAIVERLLRAGETSRPALKQPIADILFKDLLEHPLDCVKRIYEAAGDALDAESEARMSAWIADNQQGKHGGHDYSAEDFGLDVEALKRRFAFYSARLTKPA